MPTDESTGLAYVDGRTQYLKLERPYADNKLIIDVDRLDRTIIELDRIVGTLARVASTGDYEDLVNKPDLVALKKQILLEAHPVGSYYISNSATSPATLFGGTWERIQGRFLYAADGTYGAGATGGAATRTLTVANLPAHNHGVTIASNGAHTHTTTSAGDHTHTAQSNGAHTHTANSAGAHTHTTTSAGAHTHTRGTMNITGEFATSRADDHYTGAFSRKASGKYSNRQDASDGHWIAFDASNSWSGATSSAGAHTHTANSAGAHTHSTTSAGAHTHATDSKGAHTHTANSAGAHAHTATCANTGSSSAFSILPPLLGAYIWRRTA